MKRGYLSEYFEGVAIKTLSRVDITPRSNQHEFGTTKEMREFMGIPQGGEHWHLPTRFVYLDDDDEPVMEDDQLTYYDTRFNQPKRKPEYRCYYRSSQVTQLAQEGDLLVVAKRRGNEGMLVIVAAAESTVAGQLEWLFGLSQTAFPGFSVRTELEQEQDRIGFAATFILESIGVEVESNPQQSFLDVMLEKFGPVFPPTRAFSAFARSTLPDLDPREDPDAVLMAWMEREEILFRTLEKHIVGDWLQRSFTGEVEDFMKQSLSIQNRRKSRAGSALEGHLATLFAARGIAFTPQAKTENNAKPDFLFPADGAYHQPGFPDEGLTMLAVKTTCKDRWRQVLSEASRIPKKHLLTLESAISTNQTDEMASWELTLVVPTPLQASYTAAQRQWLWSLQNFTELVSGKQRRFNH
jgi:hypothetical protein